jgi:hypothetical protein
MLLCARLSVVAAVRAEDRRFESSLEQMNPYLATYHPLSPGFRWTYQVSESGREYRQDVRLESGEEANTLVLIASSPWRRTRFYLQVRGDSLLLTRAEGRLPFLPIGKSRGFQPPLLLLAVGPALPGRWKWRESDPEAEFQLDTMDCLASAGESPDSIPSRKSLCVRSLGTIARREFTCRQTYVSGIGLVHMVADRYEKVLVAYQTPNHDARHWPDIDRHLFRDRAGLGTP